MTRGAIFTSSAGVVSVLTSMIMGVSAAFQARNEYLSWTSEEWDAAYAEGLRAARQAFPS